RRHPYLHPLFSRLRRPPWHTLFPYTTLFRSFENRALASLRHAALPIMVSCARLTSGKSTANGICARRQSSSSRPSPCSSRIRYPDRKSTRLNSSHLGISYAVFCLKKKKPNTL